ncbi:MAG: hypothetical protein ACTHV5_09790, partial [Candidatus Corynebacterium faecigallinarum]
QGSPFRGFTVSIIPGANHAAAVPGFRSQTRAALVSDEVADTVRFELQHLRRFRREDEAIPTDAPMWLWFPKV